MPLANDVPSTAPTLRGLESQLRDLRSRLDTIEAVTRSAIAATDEHTIEGRRARYGLEIVRRMREELTALEGPEDE
jgi:hypothetical protein